MTKYPKIQSIFKRDPENNYKTFLDGQYSEPEFAVLRNLEWEWTEKIDGTNVRVEVGKNFPNEDLCAIFKGRTDNAQMPTFLLTHLQTTFSPQGLGTAFASEIPEGELPDITLYGEGYGAKIQKRGGLYIPDGVGFILFDVRVGNIWLKYDAVRDIADKLGVPTVPRIGWGTLDAAVRYVRHDGFMSQVSALEKPAEGLVLRAPCGLLTRMGKRIITKVKAKDFETE